MILVSGKLAQAADLLLDTNLAFKHDNDISLAEPKNDIFSDEIVTFKLVASRKFKAKSTQQFKCFDQTLAQSIYAL